MNLLDFVFPGRGRYRSFEAAESAPSSVRHLHLVHVDVMAYEGRFAKFHELRSLSIQWGDMNRLPSDIATLKKLYRLEVLNCPEAVPDWAWSLTNLESLVVRGTNMDRLPPEIRRLTRLRTLQLGNNRLTAIPEELSQLRRLRYLYVSDNRLKAVPQQLDKLNSLRAINLAGNPFSEETLATLHARFGRKLGGMRERT